MPENQLRAKVVRRAEHALSQIRLCMSHSIHGEEREKGG